MSDRQIMEESEIRRTTLRRGPHFRTARSISASG
jgi:hypothetical protein